MQRSDSALAAERFVTCRSDSFSSDLIWNQLEWLTIITYCAKYWIYGGWQYYVSECSPELLGLQAESHHTLVSLWWKTPRPSRVLSKSCLTSAEESGTDTCQETSAGVPAQIWLDCAVSQMVLGRLNLSEEGNKCKFNIWGLFEVHLHLNECDRTWNDPCWKGPLTAMKRVERDKHWWQ